jgi:hypothetical protein
MANLDAPLRSEDGPGEGFPGASTAEASAASVRPGGLHRIIVVGGGAGGLELVTRLGDKLGKRNRAHVTLIERERTHFWKPHLHEIAAGSMDIGVYETNYLAQSHWHYFRYRIGEMIGLNRERRSVTVAPFVDEDGDHVTPQREFPYDTLVMAVGSLTNDFGIRGAKEYAISLETAAQAERFHRRLVNAYIRAHAQAEPLRPEQLQVAIIAPARRASSLPRSCTHARTLVPTDSTASVEGHEADSYRPPIRIVKACRRACRMRRPSCSRSSTYALSRPRAWPRSADGVRLASGRDDSAGWCWAPASRPPISSKTLAD